MKRAGSRGGISLSGVWRRCVAMGSKLGNNEELGKFGDFSTTPRTVLIALIAIGIGLLAAFVALILLTLIRFFTNLFFFQRVSVALSSPAANKLGLLEIFVPVIGGLIVGLMARYGSERIRGHGIPEAIEAILINGSRMKPRVAFLKPISAAIAIGSGGPFGAEGPIIMTGGAFGSIVAQAMHLTNAERKTLLVAGAAAGMAAIFATPIAAVLLAVELLLFEWKPRSLIPVALASATAAFLRNYLIGPAPFFPVPVHAAFIGPLGLLGCVLVGVLAGVVSLLLSAAVYASEDAFRLLPIHWMWWPAIGGLVIGIGGLIFPQALGVGYDVINAFLQGHAAVEVIIGVLLVKSIIWAVSLGSGSSGGVLAPILMIGCALGALLTLILPNEGLGFWPLIAMGAMLGGTMRAPFTGVVFAVELTHDINALLPLLVATAISYGFTVLFMRRSILTEKVARRGYLLSCEYAIDPLEIILVREVMRTKIVALAARVPLKDLTQSLRSNHNEPDQRGQHLYPVLDDNEQLLGVVTRKDLQGLLEQTGSNEQDFQLVELIKPDPVVAYPDEPLRAVVDRMAETNFTRLPVVEREDPGKIVGIVALTDLLKATVRTLDEERQRERVLQVELLFARRGSKRVERVLEEVEE